MPVCATVEDTPASCYMEAMSPGRIPPARSSNGTSGLNAHSTMAFAAIDDHARLPARFFARLLASDGPLALL